MPIEIKEADILTYYDLVENCCDYLDNVLGWSDKGRIYSELYAPPNDIDLSLSEDENKKRLFARLFLKHNEIASTAVKYATSRKNHNRDVSLDDPMYGYGFSSFYSTLYSYNSYSLTDSLRGYGVIDSFLNNMDNRTHLDIKLVLRMFSSSKKLSEFLLSDFVKKKINNRQLNIGPFHNFYALRNVYMYALLNTEAEFLLPGLDKSWGANYEATALTLLSLTAVPEECAASSSFLYLDSTICVRRSRALYYTERLHNTHYGCSEYFNNFLSISPTVTEEFLLRFLPKAKPYGDTVQIISLGRLKEAAVDGDTLVRKILANGTRKTQKLLGNLVAVANSITNIEAVKTHFFVYKIGSSSTGSEFYQDLTKAAQQEELLRTLDDRQGVEFTTWLLNNHWEQRRHTFQCSLFFADYFTQLSRRCLEEPKLFDI